MTDAELSRLAEENDFVRSMWEGCLATEQAKVTLKNRYALHNTPDRVQARAWDFFRAMYLRHLERKAA